MNTTAGGVSVQAHVTGPPPRRVMCPAHFRPRDQLIDPSGPPNPPPMQGAHRAPVPPWKLSPAEASAAARITAEALGPRPPNVTTTPPPLHGHLERHHHHHGWPPRAGQQKCEPLAIHLARPQGAMRTESAPDATPSCRLSTHHHPSPRPIRQWYVIRPFSKPSC